MVLLQWGNCNILGRQLEDMGITVHTVPTVHNSFLQLMGEQFIMVGNSMKQFLTVCIVWIVKIRVGIKERVTLECRGSGRGVL